MRQDPCQFARDCSIHEFHNIEVCWEKDIKIPLMYLLNISSKIDLGKDWCLQKV
jgi:hypothetical protein